MEKKKGLHYGWLIVFSCFMIMSLYLCIVMNCPGLFLISVTEEFGISRSQYTLNTTVISVAMMIVSLNAGRIFSADRIKKVMMISSIILPVAYFFFSKATNIYMFYLISAIVGFCLGLCGMVPMSTLITRWFNEKRGLATGLAFTGSGLGGMVLQPIIGKLIATTGWRNTYAVLAVIMFVLVVPCTVFIIKNDPADKGLEPYGGAKKPMESAPVVEAEGMTLAQARKKAYFWMYLPLVTLTSAAACSMVQNVSPYVTDLGFDPTVAASLSALSLGILAGCKVLLGQIFDKKGSLFSTVMSLICMGVACFCYASATNSAFLYAGLVISGLGIAYTTVGYPINTQAMFGKKDYSAVYGNVASFSAIGTALGSPVTSIIYDATGSYRMAWAMWAVVNAVAVFVFIALTKMAEKDTDK
ncbi:MAG: MFS transporter [Oscillospiraceae bacterium]|nr:MFS transporter [Oscillospiraceae bacterium]